MSRCISSLQIWNINKLLNSAVRMYISIHLTFDPWCNHHSLIYSFQFYMYIVHTFICIQYKTNPGALNRLYAKNKLQSWCNVSLIMRCDLLLVNNGRWWAMRNERLITVQQCGIMLPYAGNDSFLPWRTVKDKSGEREKQNKRIVSMRQHISSSRQAACLLGRIHAFPIESIKVRS